MEESITLGHQDILQEADFLVDSAAAVPVAAALVDSAVVAEVLAAVVPVEVGEMI